MKHRLTPSYRVFAGGGFALLIVLKAVLAESAPAQGLTARADAAEKGAPSQTVKLAPHRAVYELSLAETGPGSNVTDIRGQLIYDFQGSACAGYVLNTRLTTELYDRDGKPALNDIRTESWEDGEGRRFRFATTQYSNNKQTETTKGSARRLPRGQNAIAVEIEKPKKSSLTFKGKILFPTQFSAAVLKAAFAGQPRLQADVYDGSEKGAKIYETATVIGASLQLSANAQLPAIKNAELLDTVPSWPVVMSYYDPTAKKDGLPAYEISFRMYSNGVSRKLKLDYAGAFSLNGEISSIEFFEPKPCP
jgi:EipB-like